MKHYEISSKKEKIQTLYSCIKKKEFYWKTFWNFFFYLFFFCFFWHPQFESNTKEADGSAAHVNSCSDFVSPSQSENNFIRLNISMIKRKTEIEINPSWKLICFLSDFLICYFPTSSFHFLSK